MHVWVLKVFVSNFVVTLFPKVKYSAEQLRFERVAGT